MDCAIINEANTLKYLKKYEKKINKRGKLITFSCSFCKGQAAHFIPNSGAKVSCPTCQKKYTLLDIVRSFEPKYQTSSDEDIISYLSSIFQVPVVQEHELDFLFKFYHGLGLSLVPISSKGDGKRPIESDWTNKEHKDIEEWKSWAKKGFNFGIATGKISNISVIDVDNENEIPDCLKNVETLTAKTKRGLHFIFLYDENLPSKNLRHDRENPLPIEILSDGRQIVASPSITEGFKRIWLNYNNIIAIPDTVKKWLLPYYTTSQTPDQLSISPDTNLQNVATMTEGSGRNSMLIHLGGILKSDLSVKQCSKVLDLINSKFFVPPLSKSELANLLKSLDKYIGYDEKALIQKVYDHLRMVEFGNARELAESLHERKDLIEKALSYLMLNEMVYKRGRSYYIIPHLEISDRLIDNSDLIPFKVPYFNDIAIFNWCDTLLIGAESKIGKTHIALNIIKMLVDQQIKPMYHGSEPGSRFKKIGLTLGLRDGDFDYLKNGFCYPEELQFRPNTVNVVDWILPTDYSQTDKILRDLSHKINKAHGFLILFMQLKDDGEWYSKNMVKFFPVLTARYFYDDKIGTTGYFKLDNIREPKKQIKEWKIPCRYDFASKELIEITPEDIIDDLVSGNTNETPEDKTLGL